MARTIFHKLGSRTVTDAEWRAVVQHLTPFEIDTLDILRIDHQEGRLTEWTQDYAPARWRFAQWLYQHGRLRR